MARGLRSQFYYRVHGLKFRGLSLQLLVLDRSAISCILMMDIYNLLEIVFPIPAKELASCF